jgi:hypothetical protein
MVAFTALYDACVLYPAPVRDVLMHLALADLYRAGQMRFMTKVPERVMRMPSGAMNI